jgi:hypothetical protein
LISMDEQLDLFRRFRHRAAPPGADARLRASALLGQAMDAEKKRAFERPRRTRVVVLAVAALVVVVGTASAFATARTVLGGGHPYLGTFLCDSDSGSVVIQASFEGREGRTFAIMTGTGRYAGVTGHGWRISIAGGNDSTWQARLVGKAQSPDGAWQKIAITITGKLHGRFVLKPLQRGYLAADTGRQSSAWAG